MSEPSPASDVIGRLRARIAQLSSTAEGHGNAAEERLLERRAQRLARSYRATEAKPVEELAVFTRRGARYGVAIEDLMAIEALATLTPIPGVDPAVAGVVHRLGRIHAVLDLAVLLHGPGKPGSPEEQAARWIVFVTSGAVAVGLLADQLNDIVQMAQAERSTLAGLPARVLPAIRGLTPDLITILEPAGLITEEIVGARPT